jgi:antitoxin component YwqK of YwqJK toxin-antitoxin module
MRNYLFFILVFIFTGFASQAQIDSLWNRVDNKGLKQGRHRDFYPKTKNLRYEGQFIDNKPVGTFKFYYPETFELNAIHEYDTIGGRAKITVYYKNKKIMATGFYLNQQKDSIWKFYDNLGDFKMQEFYRNNKRNGEKIVYYNDSTIFEIVTFKDDIQEGPYKIFYSDKNLKEEGQHKNGDKEGYVVYYNPGNKPLYKGTYLNHLKEGEWIRYNDDGTEMQREYYKQGLLQKTTFINGIYSETYANETPKCEYTYKNGKKNGAFKEYYDNAIEVREKVPAYDGSDGKDIILSFENQTLKVKGAYLNDKLHGKVTYYKPDGSIEKVVMYNNGIAQKTELMPD